MVGESRHSPGFADPQPDRGDRHEEKPASPPFPAPAPWLAAGLRRPLLDSAIALVLLFFGVDQFFVSKLPGTGAIEHPRSIPQRVDLPAAHALASLDRDRQ